MRVTNNVSSDPARHLIALNTRTHLNFGDNTSNRNTLQIYDDSEVQLSQEVGRVSLYSRPRLECGYRPLMLALSMYAAR